MLHFSSPRLVDPFPSPRSNSAAPAETSSWNGNTGWRIMRSGGPYEIGLKPEIKRRRGDDASLENSPRRRLCGPVWAVASLLPGHFSSAELRDGDPWDAISSPITVSLMRSPEKKRHFLPILCSPPTMELRGGLQRQFLALASARNGHPWNTNNQIFVTPWPGGIADRGRLASLLGVNGSTQRLLCG